MPLRLLLLACFFFWPTAVEAIPLFADQYGVACQKCHSVIPKLNPFGAAFLAHGNRIPGVAPGPAFPLAARVNLVASSERQGNGPDGAGLPKAIVDEVELFTAGLIGSRASYFVEQYVVDGGEHGALRDALVVDRVTPWNARIPVTVQAGQFTLPVPVDPETFRESYQHYTLFDQTVGANPFNFFDPKIGAQIGVGDPSRGASVQLFAGPGHDRFSGLARSGTDVMSSLQYVVGPVTATTYRYAGTRTSDTLIDRFERQGFSLVYATRRWTTQSVLQTGYDAHLLGGGGSGAASSGGFSQVRYDVDPRLFLLARYEGTNAPNGFTRDGVVLIGFRPSHNAAITVEDVVSHVPHSVNTLNFQYTAGY